MTAASYLDRRAEEMLIRQPDLSKWMSPDEAEKFQDASTFRDQVKQSFLDPGLDSGDALPWQKATGFRFRPGEMTIWTGYNGHKKSMVMGQVILGFLGQGSSACVASLEMKPVKSLKRLIRQYVGVDDPGTPYQDRFFDWATGKLWFYNHVGAAKPERMIGVARYAIAELGVQHVVIDSLMKCGIGGDDLDKQKWFVDQLHSVAHDHSAHVHLVAHSKKPQDGNESRPPTKYGTSGSADITNIPDNTLAVFCDKAGKHEYDLLLMCEKQREGDDEPTYKLFFDSASLQAKPYEKASLMSAQDWELGRWR